MRTLACAVGSPDEAFSAPVLAPFAAIAAAQPISPTTAAAQPFVEAFPQGEDLALLAVAKLPAIQREGDVIRYVLHHGFGYNTKATARIVQAVWAYGAKHPRVLRIELAMRNNDWQVIERKEAAMHPIRFGQLTNNVAAAASVVGDRSRRGSVTVCSHAATSRLDLSLPDEQRMRIARGAHCSDDAPAVVAGELLTAAVDLSLKLNWSPTE